MDGLIHPNHWVLKLNIKEEKKEMSDEKQKSIGALWKQESKGGFKYLSGNVEVNGEVVKVVVFPNKFKDEQKEGAPDFRIMESKYVPKEEEDDVGF